MPLLRLCLHILFAGLHVFFTALALLLQISGPGLTVMGVGLLLLLGAWAGASSMLRTKQSLISAAAGIGLLFALALRGDSFSFEVNVWVLAVMVPLSLALWAVVAWRTLNFRAPPRSNRLSLPG